MRPNFLNQQWLRARNLAIGLLTALAACASATADVFHLRDGGRVTGQLLGTSETAYQVRTTVGIVSLPIDAVERRESAPSPFEEYDRRAADAAENADAHFQLAAWCDEHGLVSERRRHLRRTLELNPDHAAARAALGFVRVGSVWVDGRGGAARSGATAVQPSPEDSAEAEAKLVRAVQGEWMRRIRAIRTGLLDSLNERHVEDGRRQIGEIRDPLAIVPLARVLAGGDRVCRELLVDRLAAFPQDEATMNLAVLALTDREADIRSRALAELRRRDDPRVSAQYRKALRSDNDELIRRAAVGLGALGAAEAVPELIETLTVQRNKMVEVPVRTYFGGWLSDFNEPTTVSLSGALRVNHNPEIGVVDYTGGVAVDNVFRLQRVTVYRTEVLEALKQLTGQNFGFEAAEWRTWYEERRS